EKIDYEILKETMKKMIDSYLTEREKKIIEMRFGLLTGEEETQQTIADKLGISRSYVSRIEKKALSKLKKGIIENKLQPE
ncbi:MAG: sigma-70 family RNA polymerase sigma factor, partial [Clostridia bacterium]|nr:sigma-70 family RNA polymerase sigma factor [Clostridia bacterium]